PSNSLTQTYARVCLALTTNGRIAPPKGPAFCTTSCVFASATNSHGDFKPPRYIREPSRLTTVLCAPLFVSITFSSSPLSALTTFHVSFSNDGTYRILPSGVIDMRSQPKGRDLTHSVFSVTRSRQ